MAQGPIPGSSCRNAGNSRPTRGACSGPAADSAAAAAASGRGRGESPHGAKPQGKGHTGPKTRPTDGKTGGQRQSAPASRSRPAQAERADLLKLADEKQRRSVLLEQQKAEQQKSSAEDRRSSNGHGADPAVQAAREVPPQDPAVQAAREVPQQPVTQGDVAGCTSANPEPCKQPRAAAPRQQAMPAAAEARPNPEDSRRKAKEKKAAKAAKQAEARMAKLQGYKEGKQKAAAALKAAQEAEAAAAAARAHKESHSAAAEATAAAEAAQEGHEDTAGQAQVDVTADGDGWQAPTQAQPVAAVSTAAAETERQAVPQAQAPAEAGARPGQAGQLPAAAQPQCKPGSAAAAPSPAVDGTQPAAAMAELAADAAGAAQGQQLNVAEAQQAAEEGRPRAKGLGGQGPLSGSAHMATTEHHSGQPGKAAHCKADAAAVATPAGDRQQPAAAKAQQAAKEGKGLEGQTPLSEGPHQVAEGQRCREEEAAQREGGAAATPTPAGDRQQPAAAMAELPAGRAAHGRQPAAAQAQQATEGLEGQGPLSEGAQKAPAKPQRWRAEEAARQQAIEQAFSCSSTAKAPMKGRTDAGTHAEGLETSRRSGHAGHKTKPRPEARSRGKAAQTDEEDPELGRWAKSQSEGAKIRTVFS